MIVAGLDVGTTSVKGLALDTETGTVTASAEEGYPFATRRPGWAEQDPEVWWRAAQAVLARLGPVRGIGLSGQMHRLVALDERHDVLRPALLWNDQRTAAEVAEIDERLGGIEGAVELVGNRTMTGFTAPKLLWMARHEPELYARVRTVMLPKDYVRLRLGAGCATDVTDASGTGWFDVSSRSWSPSVLAALEVDPDWLPPALESAQSSGRADSDVPVAAGAGDQAVGAVGGGNHGAWSGIGRARHLRRGLRRVACVRRGTARSAAVLLPRGAGRLARDGRDAVGGGITRMAPAGDRCGAVR